MGDGFRLERGVENGGWLRYPSTTARGEIWIAGVPPRGPWLLSIDHPGVAAELAVLPSSALSGPGLATFKFNSLTALHAPSTESTSSPSAFPTPRSPGFVRRPPVCLRRPRPALD